MAFGAEGRTRLPGTVLALGVVSLLTDASSEMIFPLLPAFLSARVGAAPLVLGAMEGLAEVVAALFKLYAGRLADRAKALRPLVLAGYALSTVARPWMAAVTSWWQPLLIRSVDRVGKGVRGAPRDAMIAGWVEKGRRGGAFGFHRAMDHAGAALGSVSAAALVALGVATEHVFIASLVPGLLAVAAIAFTREPPARPLPTVEQHRALEPVPRRLFNYLFPVFLFALSNASDAFLLLLLSSQGAPPELLPLAHLALHVVKAAASTPAGKLADRVGSERVVLAGWGLHALAFAAFAFSPSVPVTFALVALYGLYHALSEGAEKALLADLAPEASRGRAFGLYHALSGVGLLAAGLGFGALWSWAGPRAAFLAGAAVALSAGGLLVALLPRARTA